jgi:hypothetical protein
MQAMEREEATMADFFVNGPGLVVMAFFFAFFWLPFALGAYLVEQWNPERARRLVHKLVHPTRHISPGTA